MKTPAETNGLLDKFIHCQSAQTASLQGASCGHGTAMAAARNAVVARSVRSPRAGAADPPDGVTPLAKGSPLPARPALPANRRHPLKAYEFIKQPTRKPPVSGAAAGGFTLVEVMVALVIVSIALTGMSVTMGGMLNNATTLRERTYASWIAQNKIVEYRLANEMPETGTTSGEVEYANNTWEWEADVRETGVENLLRIDVAVGFAGSNQAVRVVTGFVGEPIPPGQGNRAWSGGAPDEGVRQ